MTENEKTNAETQKPIELKAPFPPGEWDRADAEKRGQAALLAACRPEDRADLAGPQLPLAVKQALSEGRQKQPRPSELTVSVTKAATLRRE